MVDAVTQTDPIPGLETLEQLKTKNKIETQQNLNTELKTVSVNSQTAPPSNETQKQEKNLKNATNEMITKDLKKQTQAKLKSQSSQKQQTHITSDRNRKGSRDQIKHHNRFGSLSDSSDMEYLDAPTPRTNINRSRSPIKAP